MRMQSRWISLVFGCLSVVAGHASVLGKLYTASPTSAVLDSIAGYLDAAGLDVRHGPVTRETEVQWNARPQVASLESLPAPSKELGTSADGFAELFVRSAALNQIGVDTFLVAVGDAPPEAGRSLDAFKAVWDNAPRDKRVFVSFAKADHARAAMVEAALKKAGYVTFGYIHEGGDRPWTNSVEVGKFFEQSGITLVIDTQTARSSVGVQVERATALGLRDGSLAKRLAGEESFFELKSAGGGGCCKFCRGHSARGGCPALFDEQVCGPVICGPFCGNATP